MRLFSNLWSIIDHRWRQNVVRTKKWHTRHSRVCHWCSYHILTSFVIYRWTDARQHGIYLFYIIKNLKYTDKMPFYFIFRHFDRHENSTDVILGAIHSTKISGNFGPKLNGSVRSNRKSFEKTGPPFEVVLFSRSDRLEFWLNRSRPLCL